MFGGRRGGCRGRAEVVSTLYDVVMIVQACMRLGCSGAYSRGRKTPMSPALLCNLP